MLRRVSTLRSLGEIDVLSVSECDRIAETLLELRDHWTVRSPSRSFFTLGVNAYMDLAPSADVEASYFNAAGRSNTVLEKHFGVVHCKLQQVLERELGMPTRFAEDLPMPGFHIWVAPGIPHRRGASVHFDLQYERLLTRPRYARASGTMSFTLPIRLPSAGSSLNVWPGFSYPDDLPRLAAARDTPPKVVRYRVGSAVVHTGHVLHQIGPSPAVEPDDVRITLQGHGLVVERDLVLYW